MHVLILQVNHLFTFHENFRATFHKETNLCHYLRVTVYIESREQQSWSEVWSWASGQAHLLNNGLFPTGWPYLLAEVFQIQTSAKCLCVMNLAIDPELLVT